MRKKTFRRCWSYDQQPCELLVFFVVGENGINGACVVRKRIK